MGRWRSCGLGVATLAAVLWCTALPADEARRLERAIQLFDDRQYDEARALLESLVADEPQNAPALWNRGLLAMHDEDHGEAIRWFDRAISADDRVADYHLWRGYAYAQKVHEVGLLRKAFAAPKIRRSLERAVELAPQEVRARKALMEFYMRAPFFLGGSEARARQQAETIGRLEAGD